MAWLLGGGGAAAGAGASAGAGAAGVGAGIAPATGIAGTSGVAMAPGGLAAGQAGALGGTTAAAAAPTFGSSFLSGLTGQGQLNLADGFSGANAGQLLGQILNKKISQNPMGQMALNGGLTGGFGLGQDMLGLRQSSAPPLGNSRSSKRG